MEAYEKLAGREARQALAAAHGDPAALARVIQHFGQTRAGTEAIEQLAAYHLDRGHFDLAAGYLDRLLQRAEAPRPLTLFQAALAFRRSGQADRAERAWKRLATAAPDGLSVGDRTFSLGDLEKTLKRGPGVVARSDDLIVDPSWPASNVSDDTVAAWWADAVRRKEAAGQPVLPAGPPIAVGGLVIERTDRGIRAVDSRTGLTAWESTLALALAQLVRDPACHAHVRSWMESYLANHPGVVLDNSLIGTLSTDGRRVYAVDDLPVPPRPSNYPGFHSQLAQGVGLGDAPELSAAIYRNRLLALDARSGKVQWEFGGPRDSYVLGPPLPLGGQLYLPVQSGYGLRLVCLDPLRGRVVWTQSLATFSARLTLDGGRRLHAVRLAYGDGRLICPTHAGGLIAFDLVGRSLAWAHAYRKEVPAPEPPLFMGRGRGRRPRRFSSTSRPTWPVNGR